MNENFQSGDAKAQSSLIKSAAAIGMSQDGSYDGDDEDDENIRHGDNETTVCRGDVYVSVFNPTGEAAFKPSKTKPLPKWMSLLPSNVEKERALQRNIFPAATCLHPHDLDSLGDSTKDTDSPAATEDETDPIFASDVFTPKARPRVRIALPDSPDTPPSPLRRVSTIQVPSEPTREHAYGDIAHETEAPRATQDVDTFESVQSRSPPIRQSTPYPGARTRWKTMEATGCKNSLFCSEDTAAYSAYPGKEHSCDHGVQPNEYVVKRRSTLAESTLPAESTPHSSEYIKRYAPKVADSDLQKYEAKTAKPILEKIKRQRIGKLNMAQITERKRNESSRAVKIQDEEYGLNLIREDLQRELRNLFNEE
jgi:hypothetical protein